MSLQRNLSYSICTAIVITAVASVFYKQGGEFLAVPGSFIEFVLIWLVLAIPIDELYLVTPPGTHLFLNVVFYSLALFLLLCLIQRLRDLQQK